MCVIVVGWLCRATTLSGQAHHFDMSERVMMNRFAFTIGPNHQLFDDDDSFNELGFLNSVCCWLNDCMYDDC